MPFDNYTRWLIFGSCPQTRNKPQSQLLSPLSYWRGWEFRDFITAWKLGDLAVTFGLGANKLYFESETIWLWNARRVQTITYFWAIRAQQKLFLRLECSGF